MRRMIACLPVLLALATTACSTDRVPLSGIVVSSSLQNDVPSGYVTVTSLLPAGQHLRVRVNGEYLIWKLAPGDFRHIELTEFGAEVGTVLPAGPYVVELVDPSGSVWSPSASITVHPAPPATIPFYQYSSVVFIGEPGHVMAKNVEPLPNDGDPATAEITVMNLVAQPVAVDLCDIGLHSTACAPIGTVAPGDEFRTVQAIVAGSLNSGHVLRVRPADAAAPYSDVTLQTPFTSCQVQEIFATGQRELIDSQTGQVGGLTDFIGSSCLDH
jgi:hypothetical protein